MASRNYQYETSPRKYEPEYNDKPKKRKSKKAKKTTNTIQERKAKRREEIKFKFTMAVHVIILFAIIFTGLARQALINQSFSEIQRLKTQISDIEKENSQLEIAIQNSLNLSTIEQTAKEMLGMQKLSTKQTVYLALPKKDYVEPSTEEVVIEENVGILQSIINFIHNIF